MDLQLRSLTTVLSWKDIYGLKEQNQSKSLIIVRHPFHRYSKRYLFNGKGDVVV